MERIKPSSISPYQIVLINRFTRNTIVIGTVKAFTHREFARAR